MGTWTLGADNATVRNVPEPGPGPIQARRPIPQLSRINAIRFDGKSIYHGVTFKAERRLRTRRINVSYTLAVQDDASSRRDGRPTTQDVRNILRAAMGTSASTTHQFMPAVCINPASMGAVGQALLAAARQCHSRAIGAPFCVNLSVDRANIGLSRPAPRSMRDRICQVVRIQSVG
jgi:hypothetical protein